jgi:hypothetical protein
MAADVHGLPEEVIIDNGKDYRSKSLSGGRSRQRFEVDEAVGRSMFGGLKIGVHFALPYNAQTKPIERDFLKFKNWLSRTLVGYRGGNVVERPEVLEQELKAGKIMAYSDFEPLFNRFVADIFNNMPSQGKVLKGQSPNAYWNAYFAKERLLRRVSPEALRLFCARTKEATIQRNGIRDSELGLIYWDEWMTTRKGERVYMRRPKKAYQEAWVFSAATDEYLGLAVLTQSYNAISRSDIDKDKLKALMAMKKQELKLKKALIKVEERPTADHLLDCMAAGVKAIAGEAAPAPQSSRAQEFEITELDKAVAKQKKAEKVGRSEIGQAVPPRPPAARKVFAFRSDMPSEPRPPEARSAG